MNNDILYEWSALLGGNRADALRIINNEISRTNLSEGTLFSFYKMVGRFPNDDEAEALNSLFKFDFGGMHVAFETIVKTIAYDGKFNISPIFTECGMSVVVAD